MIKTLALLLLYQLIGELTTHLFGLPIPGPVIGMALLFLTLLLMGSPSSELKAGAAGLLQHLSLFFVPAGVGIILHLHRVAAEWLPIVAAVLLSTLAGMTVTAVVIRLMAPHAPPDAEERA